MLEGSIEDLKKIAANASTPSHLLIELSKHEDSCVRSLVASNPNTPLETLKCLGSEFADAIVENPVFDLLKLEDANSEFVRLTLARSTKTPPEVLAKLIATENPDVQICWEVANNINTPIDALGNLAIEIVNQSNSIDDWFSWFVVVAHIIGNPNISESCLEKILDISIDRKNLGLLYKFTRIPISYRMLEKISLYPAKHPDSPPRGCLAG